MEQDRNAENESFSNTKGKPPEHEEIKKMLEGVFEKMGGVSIDTNFQTVDPEEVDLVSEEVEDEDDLEFNYLPREIKAHLDRYIIRQDSAKKALAIAVCDHYNSVRFDKEQKGDEGINSVDYHKQNVLITGPTGVGKTYLVKHIADLIGVPFIKADATKFSETGYVGRDVDDLVRDLVKKAGGSVELAEYGIIYIDEIDKLAGSTNSSGRDVSGRGVQTTLLKLMEETEVSLVNPMDMQSQMMQVMRGSGEKKDTINTRHILFIVSGAFSGLDQIIERRTKAGNIGFAQQPVIEKEEGDVLSEVETEDFMKYGFEAEFIGRLPVRVHCEALTKQDLASILRYSEGSILRQYERQFLAYGVEAKFTEDAIDYVAEIAEKQKTGARALMTVLENLLREFKYEIPGTGVTELKIDRDLLENKETKILEYSKLGQVVNREHAMRELTIFSRNFYEKNRVKLDFTPDAVDALIARKEDEGQSLLNICNRLYRDYSYGVQLIRSKKGVEKLEMTKAAVDDSDKFLSDLVLKVYGEAKSATTDPDQKTE